MQLAPQYLTIKGLFESRLFKIPDYQRGYSWEKMQRAHLFHDIEEAHRTGRQHFMATIVALARENITIMPDEFRSADVVDGQQRITTLVILLKAIEKRLLLMERRDDQTQLARLLVKGDDYSLLLLQTNHDSSNMFAQYIRSGKRGDHAKTLAEANILNAVDECENFVSTWCEKRPENSAAIIELWSTIRNKLSVIYHEITDEATVYRVFEVLNSRGLDVRWIDKTKSQLMSLIFEHTSGPNRDQGLNDMKSTWQKIYQELGQKKTLDSDALRFAGTLISKERPSRVLPDADAHEALCEHGGKTISQIMKAAEHLYQVVRLVRALDDDERRSAVTKIAHARFLAVAIRLASFDEDEKEKLLHLWERVTFRIFGLGRGDSRMRVGEYVRLAHDIYSSAISASEAKDRIQGLGGSDYAIDRLLANPNIWNNCYEGWTEELRYLLFRYDEYLASKAGEEVNAFHWEKIWQSNASDSIEHVIPQSTGFELRHHIGNLIMLPRRVNSKLQDDPPQEKAKTYRTSGLRDAIVVGDTINGNFKNNQPGWSKQDIDNRAEELEHFVRLEWGE